MSYCYAASRSLFFPWDEVKYSAGVSGCGSSTEEFSSTAIVLYVHFYAPAEMK